VWFPRAHAVELRQEELPDLGPEDILVQSLASAISHGTEMLVYRGQVSADLELDLPTLRGSFDFPIKYGYASVGRVAAVGSAVARPRVGACVFVHHPHQSTLVVPARMAVELPEGVDPKLGVFLANLETAINVLLDAAPRFGERVAVFGQGVVGLLLTQLVRRVGVDRLIAIEPVSCRAELAKRLGAHVVLDGLEGVAPRVRELTEGVGVDLAIEASGNGAALRMAMDCVAFQGTVVVCSWYGTKLVPLSLGESFHRRRLRMVASQVSNIDPALQPRWTRERRLALAVRLLAELELAPLISHCLPLERAAEAYQLIDEHPEDTVQVVLTYGDSVTR
jgi:2-desacetyl-2-hydroxyethyl bacteriochlorophyllide A dehydrogenase